jgi:hypothetical protein
MRCEEIAEHLSANIDGMLDADTAEELAGHIAECETCRQELAELEETVALLGQLEPVSPAPGLAARVMARIERERRRVSPWQVFSMPQVRVALAAGILVMIGVYSIREVAPVRQKTQPAPSARQAVKKQDGMLDAPSHHKAVPAGNAVAPAGWGEADIPARAEPETRAGRLNGRIWSEPRPTSLTAEDDLDQAEVNVPLLSRGAPPPAAAAPGTAVEGPAADFAFDKSVVRRKVLGPERGPAEAAEREIAVSAEDKNGSRILPVAEVLKEAEKKAAGLRAGPGPAMKQSLPEEEAAVRSQIERAKLAKDSDAVKGEVHLRSIPVRDRPESSRATDEVAAALPRRPAVGRADSLELSRRAVRPAPGKAVGLRIETRKPGQVVALLAKWASAYHGDGVSELQSEHTYEIDVIMRADSYTGFLADLRRLGDVSGGATGFSDDTPGRDRKDPDARRPAPSDDGVLKVRLVIAVKGE